MPTSTPSAKPRIGILVGHWGKDDGWVCEDGLREVDVNLHIATLVQQELAREGYTVDLLQENDSRLNQYQALALVSIHADSCDFISDAASGFKIAPALATLYPDRANALAACMLDRYAEVTGMAFRYNEVTTHMSSYHPFDEVNSITPISCHRSRLPQPRSTDADGTTGSVWHSGFTPGWSVTFVVKRSNR